MENKKQLMIFDIAKKSWKSLKDNALVLVGISLLYSIVSFIPSTIADSAIAPFIASYLNGWSLLIIFVASLAISIFLWITLMTSIYNEARSEGDVGFKSAYDFPLKNYLRTIGVLVIYTIVLALLSLAIFGGILALSGVAITLLNPVFTFISTAILLVVGVVFMAAVVLTYIFAMYETAFSGETITKAFSNSKKITHGVKRKMFLGNLLSILISLGIFILFSAVVGIIGYVGYLALSATGASTALSVGYGIFVVITYTVLYSAFLVWFMSGVCHTYISLRDQTFTGNEQ